MAKVIKPDQIDLACEALTAGKLVAFPTETVYGLGADATNSEAIEKLYEAKGRPSEHPLIVHISSFEKLRFWVRKVSEDVQKLAEEFWPGPLTIVLQRNGRVSSNVVGGRPTVGIRVPSHPVALKLLEEYDEGLAAPSANKFGGVSPTSAAHVVDDLGEHVEYVVDGGKCKVGVESTIIDMVKEPTLLRAGGVSVEAIEKVLGRSVKDDVKGKSRAPGMMASHYAPKASIDLVTVEQLQDPDFEIDPEVGVIAPVGVDVPLSWHMPKDASGYARGLYGILREADYRQIKKILIAPPSEGELMAAVLDRLEKASAPRV